MTSLRPHYLMLALLLLTCFLTPSEATDDDGLLACVTLLQYDHYDCRGDPIAIRNNTVWQTPGMPCKHTERMKGHSVTDQYCSFSDTEAPKLHQKVYVYSKSCEAKWYQKAFSPIQLSYTQHGCTHGYKIAGCTKGACENPTEEEVVAGDNNEEVSTQ